MRRCTRRDLTAASAGAVLGLAAGVLFTGNLADVVFIAAVLFVVAVLIGTGFIVGALTERRAAEKRQDIEEALRRAGADPAAVAAVWRKVSDALDDASDVVGLPPEQPDAAAGKDYTRRFYERLRAEAQEHQLPTKGASDAR